MPIKLMSDLIFIHEKIISLTHSSPLIQSFPRRVEAVMAAKGGKTSSSFMLPVGDSVLPDQHLQFDS